MDDFVWACSEVYGPNDDSQRGALWEGLIRIHSRWNIAWCVFGDFNIIRYSSERFGCRLSVRLCLRFQISLRLITLWIYHLKGLLSPGLEIRGQIVCQVLTGP